MLLHGLLLRLHHDLQSEGLQHVDQTLRNLPASSSQHGGDRRLADAQAIRQSLLSDAGRRAVHCSAQGVTNPLVSGGERSRHGSIIAGHSHIAYYNHVGYNLDISEGRVRTAKNDRALH